MNWFAYTSSYESHRTKYGILTISKIGLTAIKQILQCNYIYNEYLVQYEMKKK